MGSENIQVFNFIWSDAALVWTEIGANLDVKQYHDNKRGKRDGWAEISL